MRRVASKQAKRPSAPANSPAISQAVLGQAVVAVERMNNDERLRLVDEIHLQQPNLLASVLVHHQMGASLAQIEVLVNILLVAWLAMKTSGYRQPVISQDIQDQCMQRVTGMMLSIEGLPAHRVQRAVNRQIEQYREPHLLAFVYGRLKEHAILGLRTDVEKYLVLGAVNLVECIAATAQVPASHSPGV